MYGTNIKRIRENKRITQEDLAKRIGVSRQAVCMWETGKRELKGTMLNKIAQIFSVPVSEILSENDTVNKLLLTTGKGGSMKETLMSIARKRGKEGEIMKKASSITTFTLTAPKANRVTLTGSFNSWDKSGTPLKKEKNGTWKTDLSLKPGRYEYKFIVDGQWWTDPANRNTVRNSLGSENSIVEIKG
jgi:transcriptional regulator with XRE-family HTH domain